MLVRDELGQKPAEMALVQGDHVIEQLAPATAHPALDNPVLPRICGRKFGPQRLAWIVGLPELPSHSSRHDPRGETVETTGREMLLAVVARSRYWWDDG